MNGVLLSNACLGPELNGTFSPAVKNKISAMFVTSAWVCSPFQAVADYPGGMRQRAALIRTLATKPGYSCYWMNHFLFDYQTRLEVSDDISTIIPQTAGKTAILVTVTYQKPSVSPIGCWCFQTGRGSLKQKPDDSCIRWPAEIFQEFAVYFNLLWKEIQNHQSCTA